MQAKYKVFIPYGSKVIAKVKVDNRQANKQTDSRDRSWPRHCAIGANFSKMAQRENCMGSIWRIIIKFGADCQVHRVINVR